MEQVGGVVYVGGNFTSVRPPGSPKGTNEVPRKNMAAFDAKTGDLLPFSHDFASPVFSYDPATRPDVSCTVNWTAHTYTCDTVYEIRKSPDGTKIYVGGDFTWIDTKDRRKLAAFSTANAKTANNVLDPNFRVTGTNYRVRALAVTDTMLYAGGGFVSTAGQTRQRLAAYNAFDGTLLPWAPTADKLVLAMTMSPDNSRVILGGEFDKINGVSIHGLATVDAITGANTRFDSRPIPLKSFVTDLVTDADTVYAASNGEGAFDGRVAADPYTGQLRWVDNCLGATWSLALIGDVLYSGSHAHNCSSTDGGFPEQAGGSNNPKRWYRLLAQSTRTSQTSIQHWFPSTNGGDMSLPSDQTPSRLGPRTMTTDGEFLWVGGQFTTVNDVNQQSLTRFGLRPNPGFVPERPDRPTVASNAPGTATIIWKGVEDLDSETLDYQVWRGTSPTYTGTLVGTVSRLGKPWALPTMSYTDTGLTPGQNYTYQIRPVDPDGNIGQKSYTATTTVQSGSSAWSATVLGNAPSIYWPLGETSGTVANAVAGPNGTYDTGVTLGQPSGVTSQPANTSVRVNGTNRGRISSTASAPGPSEFTIEAFIKTTSGAGGKIAGFGNVNAVGTNSGNYDRHLYLDMSGRITFGVYPDAVKTITSPASYNNGAWHHVVATLGPAGMALYVDGVLVASDASVTLAQIYNGYWRLGGDNLSGWPGLRLSENFTGSIDDFAVYPTALTAAQVAQHYTASGN